MHSIDLQAQQQNEPHQNPKISVRIAEARGRQGGSVACEQRGGEPHPLLQATTNTYFLRQKGVYHGTFLYQDTYSTPGRHIPRHSLYTFYTREVYTTARHLYQEGIYHGTFSTPKAYTTTHTKPRPYRILYIAGSEPARQGYEPQSNDVILHLHKH